MRTRADRSDVDASITGNVGGGAASLDRNDIVGAHGAMH
jgi:hypothetical protein